MAPLTILVADEDADTRIILRTVLERRDFKIVETGTGDEALDHARRTAIDLVILNFPMVCANGQTLIQSLRSGSGTQHVPIVNLTSRVVPQYLDEAERQGATVTVHKPIDVEHVVTLINSLISRQPAASAS